MYSRIKSETAGLRIIETCAPDLVLNSSVVKENEHAERWTDGPIMTFYLHIRKYQRTHLEAIKNNKTARIFSWKQT